MVMYIAPACSSACTTGAHASSYECKQTRAGSATPASRLISVQQTTWLFVLGTAHPSTTFEVINVDPATGQRVQVARLFQRGTLGQLAKLGTMTYS